jgi:hypothetical protein
VEHLAAHEDSDVERGALLNMPLALDYRADDVVHRFALRFGEEADVSEIDAKERDVTVASALGSAQDGAVAA